MELISIVLGCVVHKVLLYAVNHLVIFMESGNDEGEGNTFVVRPHVTRYTPFN